jgi:hypothetical protein
MAARRSSRGGGRATQPNPHVTDIDHGWGRIMDDLDKLRGASTKIGILENTSRNGEGEADMVAIAAFNEFGTELNGREHVPARPAHAQAFEANKDRMNKAVDRSWDAILAGRLNPRAALGLLGEFYTGILKQAIEAFSDPANAESTQKKKGKSTGGMVDNPLIDAGQMVQSITHAEDGL